VPDFDPSRYLGDKGLRSLDRLTKLLVVAARLALHEQAFGQGERRDGSARGVEDCRHRAPLLED
jgi:hypothetical protein